RDAGAPGSLAYDGAGDGWSGERPARPPHFAADPSAPATPGGWSPREEEARAADQTAAHQALCDELSRIVQNPAGDRHEALSVMIRIFRSPAMDSLQTHGRTERWLAQLV